MLLCWSRQRLPFAPQATLRQARGVATVGLLEQCARPFTVGRLLVKGFQIPLTAMCTEEVTAIDMDRRGEFARRICDRMNDIVAQRLHVSHAQ